MIASDVNLRVEGEIFELEFHFQEISKLGVALGKFSRMVEEPLGDPVGVNFAIKQVQQRINDGLPHQVVAFQKLRSNKFQVTNGNLNHLYEYLGFIVEIKGSCLHQPGEQQFLR